MAVAAKVNWEKILSKVDNPQVKRTINLLRAKSNEVASSASKYGPVEPIDFASYKKKLRFTASAVDALEAAYKKTTLPVHTATLPAFQAQQRAAILDVISKIVDASKLDMQALEGALVEAQKNSISKDTSYGELRDRFPALAREVEQEIKNHEWSK